MEDLVAKTPPDEALAALRTDKDCSYLEKKERVEGGGGGVERLRGQSSPSSKALKTVGFFWGFFGGFFGGFFSVFFSGFFWGLEKNIVKKAQTPIETNTCHNQTALHYATEKAMRIE